MNKYDRLVADFFNGNLTDARRIAKTCSHANIRFCFLEAGYSEHKAALTADYLKTGRGWQECCDAE
jgi:hypothetical protein